MGAPTFARIADLAIPSADCFRVPVDEIPGAAHAGRVDRPAHPARRAQ